MKALTLTQPLAGATCEQGDNCSFHCRAPCFDSVRKALSCAFLSLAEMRRARPSITLNHARPRYAEAGDFSLRPF